MSSLPNEQGAEIGGARKLDDGELSERFRLTEVDAQVVDEQIRRPTRGAFARFKFLEFKAKFGHARPKGTVERGVAKTPTAYVVEPPAGRRIVRVEVGPDGQAIIETEAVDPLELAPASAPAAPDPLPDDGPADPNR